MSSRRPPGSRGERKPKEKYRESPLSQGGTAVQGRPKDDDRFSERGAGPSARGQSRRGGGGNADSHRGRYSSSSGRGKGQRFPGRLHEDNGLMALIRSLEHEEDREKCSAGLIQIEDFLQQAEREKVIEKAGETALVELADLRETFPAAAHDRLAQCCGLVGVLLGGSKFFNWVFSRIRNSKLTDPCRCWHLLALQKAIECEQFCLVLTKFGPAIFKDLASVLENASHSVLISAVGAVVAFSKVLPDVFRTRFWDIADLLIGCQVDPDQPDSTIMCASEALISLHPFWADDMKFALATMSTFVGDMGTHCATCVCEETDEMPTPTLNKITSLLKVLTTTLSAVGTRFNPHQGLPVTPAFVDEMIAKIITCVTQLSQCFFLESLLIAANGCLQVFAGCVQSYFAPSTVPVGHFVMSQLDDPDSPPTHPQAVSIVVMLAQIVEQVGNDLPPRFVDEIFGKSSPVWSLRHIASADVLLPLQRIFNSLLTSSNAALVESAYSALAADFQKNFSLVRRYFRERRQVLASTFQSTSSNLTVTFGRRLQRSTLPTMEELENAAPMSIETDSEEDETNTARNRLSSVTLAGEEEVCTGGGAEDADSSRPCSPPTTIHDAVALCVFDLNALLYVATPSDAMMPIVQSLQPPLMEVLGLGTTPSALASSGNSMGSSGHSKPSVVHGVPHEQSLLLDGSLATDFPHLHYMVAFLTYSCCKRLDFYLPVAKPKPPPALPDAERQSPPASPGGSRNKSFLLQQPPVPGHPMFPPHGPPPPLMGHPPSMGGPPPHMGGPPPPIHLHGPPPPFPPHFPPGPVPPGWISPPYLQQAHPHIAYGRPPFGGPDLYGPGIAPPPLAMPWDFPPQDEIMTMMAWSDGQNYANEYNPYMAPDMEYAYWNAAEYHPIGQQLESVTVEIDNQKREVENDSKSVKPSKSKTALGLPTPALFRQYLELLVNLLKSSFISFDTRLLCLLWSRDLLRCLILTPTMFSRHMEMTSLVQALLKSSVSIHQSIVLRTSQCLQLLLKSGVYPTAYLSEVLWTCIHHLGDSNSVVRSAYTAVLHSVPVSITTRFNGSSSGLTLGHTILNMYLDILAPRCQQPFTVQRTSNASRHKLAVLQSPVGGATGGDDDMADDVTLEALGWYWKRATTARSFNSDFHSLHFATIMGFVIHGVTPLRHVNDDWLQRIYYTCQRKTSSSRTDGSASDSGGVDNSKPADLSETSGGDDGNLFAGEKSASINDGMMWQWAMWQCAQYTVHSRLRTVFGSPQETLQQLEGVLRTLAQEMADPSSPHVFDEVPNGFVAGSGVGPRHYSLLLRVSLILQYLDNLSKLMHNAHDGTALALAAAPAVAKTFFIANRGTCRSWVNRVRRIAAGIALRCGNVPAAVFTGMKWLQEISSKGDVQHADMDVALSIVVQALIKLGASDAIQGVMAWYVSIGGSRRGQPRWMEAAGLQAQGRLEEAAALYESVLSGTNDSGASQQRPLASSPPAKDPLPAAESAPDLMSDTLGDLDMNSAAARNLQLRRHTAPIPVGPVAGITVVRRSVTAPQLPAKDMAIASSIAVLSRDSNPSSSGSPKRILCPADNSRTNNGGVVDSSRPQPASVILSKPVSNVVANEALECYVALSSWDQVSKWYSSVEEARGGGLLSYDVSIRRKQDLLRANASFDAEQYEDAAEHLNMLFQQYSNGDGGHGPLSGSPSSVPASLASATPAAHGTSNTGRLTPSSSSVSVSGKNTDLSAKASVLIDAESLCDSLWNPDELLQSSQALTLRTCIGSWQNRQLSGSVSFGSALSISSASSFVDDYFDDTASVRSVDSCRSVRSNDGGSRYMSLLRRNIRQSSSLLTSVLRVYAMDSPLSMPSLHIAQLQVVNALQQTLGNGDKQLSPKELVDTVSFRHGSLQPGVHSMAASSLLFRSASFFNAQSPQSPPSAPLSPRADFGVPMMPSSSGSSAVSFGCMQLELSRFARKLGNTGYAGRLLVQALQSNCDDVHSTLNDVSQPPVPPLFSVSDLKHSLLGVQSRQRCFLPSSSPAAGNIHSRHQVTSLLMTFLQQREASKLLHTCQESRLAIDVASQASSVVYRALRTVQGSLQTSSSTCSQWLQSAPPLAANSFLSSAKENLCKAFLDVSKWLTADSAAAQAAVTPGGEASITSLVDLINVLPSLQNVEQSGLTVDEEACGRLLEASVSQGCGIPKAWLALAAWAYKLGRRTVDKSSGGSVKLLTAEEERVRSLLPDLSEIECQKAFIVIGRVHSTQASTEAELSLLDQDKEEIDVEVVASDSVVSQLCDALPRLKSTLSPTQMSDISAVRAGVHERVFSMYRSAARAYFVFLKAGAHQSGLNAPPPSLASARIRRQLSESSHTSDTPANPNASPGPSVGLPSGQANANNLLSQSSLMDMCQTTTSTYSVDEPTAIATLRLLRLLVKHASELSQELEDGFSQTPPLSWKGIIPQLFSRLNHPESLVRDTLSALLCRLGKDVPQLITYPAVVGSMSFLHRHSSHLSSQALSAESVDNRATKSTSVDTTAGGAPSECLQRIVSMLSQRRPELVLHTKQFVSELLRISILWTEAWMQTLTHWQAPVSRCLSQLDVEAKRLLANDTLQLEEKVALQQKKHNAVLKLALDSFDQLLAETSRPAETSNEKLFHRLYKEQVKSAISSLRSPVDVLKPLGAWAPCKELLQALTQRSHKRISNQLLLSDISPRLAHMRSAVVFLPNLASEASAKETSTLQWMEDMVHVLATKTRPKKLSIIGSDGRRHTYLFKGTEDLHLDERIMQFLNMSNAMLSKGNKSGVSGLQARHYAVTPVGPKAGLIEWVDGATALYALYRRWQQRSAQATQTAKPPVTATAHSPDKTDAAQNEATAAAEAGGEHSATSVAATGVAATKMPTSNGTGVASPKVPASSGNRPVQVARPNELFFAKITPLLTAQGITDMNNRKAWPLSCLRAAYEQLVDETPGDLLETELWCSSSGSSEWWNLTQTYSRSLAVMSIIGYLIGLGDRHLDNVMVDFVTGEVVHIDYNVCFEKGRSLRIPEKVPFRLTSNLEKALGLTGVEGTFRLSCERVLRMMKTGRETLLTLLEAFVYDPLVDWATSSASDGQSAAVLLALARGASRRTTYSAAAATAASSSIAAVSQSRLAQEAEISINTSLLISRVAEVKLPWKQHCSSLLSALKEFSSCLTSLADSSKMIYQLHARNTLLYRQQQLYQAALTQPQHPLYSLHAKTAEKRVVIEERTRILKLAEAKVLECDEWNRKYKAAFAFMTSPEMPSAEALKAIKPPSTNSSPYTSIIEFLVQAGQDTLITQTSVTEQALGECESTQHNLLTGLLQTLVEYTSIGSQFPAVYIEENRCTEWRNIFHNDLLHSDYPVMSCELAISTYNKNHAIREIDSSILVSAHGILTQALQAASKRLASVQDRRLMQSLSTDELEANVSSSSREIGALLSDDKPSTNSLPSLTAALACNGVTVLNKSLLDLDQTALARGSRLYKTYSPEGDWFLDEFVSISGRVASLLQLVKQYCVEIVPDIGTLCHSANTIAAAYRSLQGLIHNFHTTISWPLLSLLSQRKVTLSHDIQSYYAAVEQSLSFTDQSECSIESLLKAAEDCLALPGDDELTSTKVDSVHTATEKIRCDITLLLQGLEVPSTTHPIQSLFILHRATEEALSALYSASEGLQCAFNWKTVDMAHAASSIQAFRANTFPSLLSDIFYLKFCLAVKNVLGRCQRKVAALQSGMMYTASPSSATTLSEEDASAFEPIQQFIADTVLSRLLGVPSQMLSRVVLNILISCGHEPTASEGEDLVSLGSNCQLLLAKVKSRAETPEVQANLTKIVRHWEVSVVQHHMAMRLDEYVAVWQSQQDVANHCLRLYEWFNEEALVSFGVITPHQFSRSSIVDRMRQHVALLEQHQASNVLLAADQLASLNNVVSSRLRWAGGSNPQLAAKLITFEEDCKTQTARLSASNIKTLHTLEVCRSIAHFETLHSNCQGTQIADQSFVSLLQKFADNSAAYEVILAGLVANPELHAMEELVDTTGWPNGIPGSPFQKEYLASALATLPQDITFAQLQVQQAVSDGQAKLDQVLKYCHHMESVLVTNKKLTAICRDLLLALAKSGSAGSTNPVVTRAAMFVKNYKSFITAVRSLLTTTSSVSMYNKDSLIYPSPDSNNVQPFSLPLDDLSQLALVSSNVHFVAQWLSTGLLSFLEADDDDKMSSVEDLPSLDLSLDLSVLQPTAVLKSHNQQAVTEPALATGNAVAGTKELAFPPSNLETSISSPLHAGDGTVRDPRTGKAVQRRNQHGISVWRRVRSKLEGRDLDLSSRRLSVQEQVDHVLRQATDKDNLSSMFEGWTSWV